MSPTWTELAVAGEGRDCRCEEAPLTKPLVSLDVDVDVCKNFRRSQGTHWFKCAACFVKAYKPTLYTGSFAWRRTRLGYHSPRLSVFTPQCTKRGHEGCILVTQIQELESTTNLFRYRVDGVTAEFRDKMRCARRLAKVGET